MVCIWNVTYPEVLGVLDLTVEERGSSQLYGDVSRECLVEDRKFVKLRRAVQFGVVYPLRD